MMPPFWLPLALHAQGAVLLGSPPYEKERRVKRQEDWVKGKLERTTRHGTAI